MSSDLSRRELHNYLAVLHETGREVGRSAKRSQLVATLMETYDLLHVTTTACARAGVAGREEQVAYCLIVLCQKSDPTRKQGADETAERVYGLDLDEDGFRTQLEHWADRVAHNLRAWATAYEAIRAEAAHHQITTLRGLVGTRPADDDVVDLVADRLASVISEGPPLQDMTLARARDFSPSGREYVFQSPLRTWVNAIARRSAPRSTHALEAAVLERPTEHEDSHEEESSEIYRSLVSHVAALVETRDPLPEVIRFAEGLERKASEITLRRTEGATRMDKLRAQLLYVADELRREQRAFGPMLEYVVLAMHRSPRLQLVAILSLRAGVMDRSSEAIANRIRAIVERGAAPMPALIAKVGLATEATRAMVPRNRLWGLERLRDDREYRDSVLNQTGKLLDGLPVIVRALSEIGAAMPGGMSPGTVASARHRVSVELSAVDPAFGRVFRRFAFRAAGPRTTLQRYVAQLADDEDAVTTAMAQRAIDQATREEALLSELTHRNAATRVRATELVLSQRILEITPAIAAQLALIAGTDSDLTARSEAAKALEKLGLPIPVRPRERGE